MISLYDKLNEDRLEYDRLSKDESLNHTNRVLNTCRADLLSDILVELKEVVCTNKSHDIIKGHSSIDTGFLVKHCDNTLL